MSYKFEMEDVDLTKVPMAEVLETLRCDTNGLSTKAAEQRLDLFGHNKAVVKQKSKIWKFLGFMWNPLSWVMEATAIMAIVLANGGGKPPDWQEFVGIIVLLLFNSTICFIEENNSENAAAALMERLSPKAKILRDGKWVEEDASILVPGDVISIKLGDIIPADARLLEGDDLKIDQSACTGESHSVTKRSGDWVFYGSTCNQGETEAVVIATGSHAFFGVAASSIWSMNQKSGCFQEAVATIGSFCVWFIVWGIIVELMHMVLKLEYRAGIENMLVLLIGGIPIAMPTFLSITMAVGSRQLSQQGAITKRTTAIEKMAGMDVLCIGRTGTLTLNKLSVERNLIEVFADNVKPDVVVLMAARASRVENQDATDAAIVGMLADPKEARAGIQEIHFLSFNPTDKRTALTYIDNEGKMHRVSKGAPEKILNLVHNKSEIESRVHSVIDNYAEQGLRSLAVAYQKVPEGTKESPGDPWQFIGLMPLFDPPRHDSAETIRRAHDLGVNVKMITGDHLAIGKETGRRIGMNTNMYPASALLGTLNEGLIEKADGFTGASSEDKHRIVSYLQYRGHICGMTGDGVDDALALKKGDIGIAAADATDAACVASDIVLAEPGLSVIISAVLTSRAILHKMKSFTTYAVSINVFIVLSFTLLAIFWEFHFPPFMVLIIAILNNSTVMPISKDRVKPTPQPDRWNLKETFTTGIILGGYLATMTVVFFWSAYKTDFFPRAFKVTSLHGKDVNDSRMLASAVFLQVSTISLALIFVTRSRGWSYAERPGPLLTVASLNSQMLSTLIAVYANWGNFVQGIGWRWAGVVWLYNLIIYIPLDPLKLIIRYAWSEKKKNIEREEQQLRWSHALRTIHGLEPPESGFTDYHKNYP